jgi:predicted transposase/invertase (TIGR01784 family)
VAAARKFEKESGEREEAIKTAVRYCREHDILKEFLEENATEVLNMLITEWNMDDALAVRFEEGMERGMERCMDRGRERGREEGVKEGREEGVKDAARKALAEGASIEFVKKITGLDEKVVKDLQ